MRDNQTSADKSRENDFWVVFLWVVAVPLLALVIREIPLTVRFEDSDGDGIAERETVWRLRGFGRVEEQRFEEGWLVYSDVWEGGKNGLMRRALLCESATCRRSAIKCIPTGTGMGAGIKCVLRNLFICAGCACPTRKLTRILAIAGARGRGLFYCKPRFGARMERDGARK